MSRDPGFVPKEYKYEKSKMPDQVRSVVEFSDLQSTVALNNEDEEKAGGARNMTITPKN